MVSKIIAGTHVKGFFLVNNIKEEQDVISKMDTYDVIFQEYIATSVGRDIRVSVFVGKVVKIVGRESQTNNEFRSNIHLGGKEVEVKLTPRIIELAEKMYKATGIKLCGMDLLYNGDDYVMCELNSVPGGLNDDFG